MVCGVTTLNSARGQWVKISPCRRVGTEAFWSQDEISTTDSTDHRILA
jgi:hypothetical protein